MAITSLTFMWVEVPGAALHHVDDELVVQLSRGDLVAGGDDRARLRLRQQVEVAIGVRRRLLDQRVGADQVAQRADRHAADRKVFERACGVDAVIGRRRHRQFAE